MGWTFPLKDAFKIAKNKFLRAWTLAPNIIPFTFSRFTFNYCFHFFYSLPLNEFNWVTSKERTIKATKKLIEQQEIKQANTKKGLELIADKLNSIKLKFSLKSGDDEKLFGSVTTQMISTELVAQGYKVDKKYISLEEPIKSLGNYFANIDFGDDVTSKIKIKVIAED